MRVLLCIRQDYYRNFAGDSMQVLKTSEYLKNAGIDVDINDGSIFDYSDYDIIHLFNLKQIGETYKYYKIAHKCKKPIVLSPLYWNLKKYYEFKNDTENIKLWKKCEAYRQEVIKGCKLLIFNSKVEQEEIKKQFTVNISCGVIYNGVEIEDEQIPLYNFRERYKLNNYVLNVGIISPDKNQLNLARICNELGIQLLVIGKVKDKVYFRKCMKYKNVLYLGFMDSYNIYNAYRFSKVYAVPSYYETPGFSTLEAAASGCTIVSTSEGAANEYFKDMAVYCNPYSYESMYKALHKGLHKKKNNNLKNYIKGKYTWEKYIRKLIQYYNKI